MIRSIGGYDWTSRFPALAAALTDLPANNLILDGEVIVQDETGIADFDALQADLASGRSERMVYFAFDLLYLDGFDLRKAPMIERKRVLSVQGGAPKGRANGAWRGGLLE